MLPSSAAPADDDDGFPHLSRHFARCSTADDERDDSSMDEGSHAGGGGAADDDEDDEEGEEEGEEGGEEEGEEEAGGGAPRKPRSEAQRAHAARIRAANAELAARRKGERADPYAAVRCGYLTELFSSPRFSGLDAASRFAVLLHAVHFHERHVLAVVQACIVKKSGGRAHSTHES